MVVADSMRRLVAASSRLRLSKFLKVECYVKLEIFALRRAESLTTGHIEFGVFPLLKQLRIHANVMPQIPRDFIRQRIEDDLSSGLLPHGVITRFPPEPNGWLHIGHAKSICLNFGVAEEYGGKTYLRFDDTNPLNESDEFVKGIKDDVTWLGFEWGDRLTFASDYFDELYDFAEELIERGKAFVCHLSAKELSEQRGSLKQSGTDSPYRNRSTEENRELFRQMRTGQFEEGECVLRAKIDMSSPNINMRDPVLYRILHASHHRTGEKWCIYPTYDYTHCICDALEGITHSLCTLEFEDHRPLYDWVLDNISINCHPPQIEFSRLNLAFSVMSKRVVTRLIRDGLVHDWDDPRLATLGGLRRRGIPPEAIREFVGRTGVTKQNHQVEPELLDFCTRQALEESTPRAMAVLDPIKVTITNFSGPNQELTAPWHPKSDAMGSRQFEFGRTLYIERGDFAVDPPRKFRRLVPGGIVRLRYAYIIRCDDFKTNADGQVVEIEASYFSDSKSGHDASGLKPKGTIHFVAESNATPAEIRIFDKLFTTKTPNVDTMDEELTPDSVNTYAGFVENAVAFSEIDRFQFERTGYFVRDRNVQKGQLAFNRIVSLSSSYRPE